MGLRYRRSRISLAAITIAVGLLGVVLSAAPASAHATLERTTPSQGSQVSSAPTSVSLTFSEGVGLSARSVEVLDSSSHRMDMGDPHHLAGQPSTVTVDLKAGMPNASYVVLWRVVSSDSHPIEGTFSFGVGVAAGTAPAAAGGDGWVGGLDGLFRGTAYAGAVLLLGGTGFLVWLWPQGMALPRPRRLVAAGWLASVFGAAGLFLLQGPYGAGLGVGSLVDLGLAGDTVGTRYGKLMLLRLVMLVFAVPVLRGLASVRGPDIRASRWNLAGFGGLFLVTFSLSEHAGQGDLVPLWAGLDAAHLGAASAWVGGLAVLTYAMLRRSAATDLVAVLPRWSGLAMVSVATLVVTGTAQAWHEVGSFSALTGTEYGLLVLAKVTALGVLLVLGDLGRRWVNRNATGVAAPAVVFAAASAVSAGRPAYAGTNPAGGVAVQGARLPPVEPSVRRLRASVTAEVAIAAVVLGLTSVLVNTEPANIAYGLPYSATVPGQGNNGQNITVTLDVARTKAGPTTMAVSTNANGRPVPFLAVGGSVTERSKGLGPVRFSFTNTGPGHGTANVVVPAAGTWTLTVQIRTDQTTDYAATTLYTVR